MEDVEKWREALDRLRTMWNEHEGEIARLEPSQWSTSTYEGLAARTTELDQTAQAVGYACLNALLAGENIETSSGPLTPPVAAAQTPVSERRVSSVAPKELVHDLLEVLELPEEMVTLEDLVEELEFLEDLTHPEELREWEALPDEIRVRLMEHLAARARALQGHPLSGPPDVDPQRIGRLFGRMADHLKQGWPGHAHGLALHHAPRAESWRRDARERIQDIKELSYAEFSNAEEAE